MQKEVESEEGMKTLPKIGEVYRMKDGTIVTVVKIDQFGTRWYTIGSQFPYPMRPDVWLADDGPELVNTTGGGEMSTWLDGGLQAAMTLGELIRCMIDGGKQNVAIAEMLDRTEPDDSGNYRLTLRVELVPNGQVRERLNEIIDQAGEVSVHTYLETLIDNGLIK